MNLNQRLTSSFSFLSKTFSNPDLGLQHPCCITKENQPAPQLNSMIQSTYADELIKFYMLYLSLIKYPLIFSLLKLCLFTYRTLAFSSVHLHSKSRHLKIVSTFLCLSEISFKNYRNEMLISQSYFL